jgi:hypothetical protein
VTALAFVYQASPTRVVFEPGGLSRLGDVAGQLNLERVLVLRAPALRRLAGGARAVVNLPASRHLV